MRDPLTSLNLSAFFTVIDSSSWKMAFSYSGLVILCLEEVSARMRGESCTIPSVLFDVGFTRNPTSRCERK